MPRQEPCQGGPRGPGKGLAGAARPTPAECVTLEPTASNIVNYVGTKAREAPPLWHADLCQDHRDIRSDEDKKTVTLGGILAEEIHETPGKILARDDPDTTARPLPKTPTGPQPGPCLPRLHRRSHAAASPPTRRAPAWQRAASRPTEQAPAWWHADLREDSTTAPTQPASQHGATCLISSDACRSQKRRR